MIEIYIATTEDEINKCFPVMAELRPHLDRDRFFEQVKRQAKDSGFRLVCLSDGEVKAVAGVRTGEWLAGGRYLEIEDLVAASGDRSKGYGGKLFDWIVSLAKREGCSELRLVSNVKRTDAHRFYLNKQMTIEAHYFSRSLNDI